MSVSSHYRPVQRTSDLMESNAGRPKRRVKWVSQISEYWLIARLARFNVSNMTTILSGDLVSDVLGTTATSTGCYFSTFPQCFSTFNAGEARERSPRRLGPRTSFSDHVGSSHCDHLRSKLRAHRQTGVRSRISNYIETY